MVGGKTVMCQMLYDLLMAFQWTVSSWHETIESESTVSVLVVGSQAKGGINKETAKKSHKTDCLQRRRKTTGTSCQTPWLYC